MPQSTDRTIQQHNDRFRAGDKAIPGSIVITASLAAHLEGETEFDLPALHNLVATFDAFTEENDPHGEHDFGMFQFAGETCYWKVDLYNPDLTGYTDDPTDLTKTFRVLTIMLAQDY